MPRRALRKIKTDLDYNRYLLDGKQLDLQWRVEPIFTHSQPLEIEIGSGKGLFIGHESVRNPNHNFLGIEVAPKYAALCAYGLARAYEGKGVENAMMIAGDATPIFTTNLLDNSVEAVHIYFPDPWWKKRHRKRRIMNPTIINNVNRVLTIGGKLHFWTDVEEYYLTSLELMKEISPLKGPFPVEETPAEDPMDYRTHFEKRTRENGLPVYRCFFVKEK